VRVVAFIFARGGSKGVPRKNLQLLGGKPLLAWSIDAALACPDVARVIVSTDDTEIADAARQHGAEVPFMRPAELAGDRSPEWLAWQHAVRHVRESGDSFDAFLSVPTTSPLRSTEDLRGCLAQLAGGDCDAVISMTPAARSPYFNMVRRHTDGSVELAIRGEASVANRQEAPALFDITTVCYAARPDYILSAQSLLEGRIKAVIVPKERALDIDDKIDLNFARFLIQSRQTP
jgi:N-acylneuraminate cytidylyltransferase